VTISVSVMQLSKRLVSNIVQITQLVRKRGYRGWVVAVVYLLAGFVVYSSGFANPFMGDDYPQIVNNPLVHSISHVVSFYSAGTIYSGNTGSPLTGVYYRPLMTTLYSLIYTVFGASPWVFHVLQLLLHVGCAFLIYLIFRRFMKFWFAFFLALVFLVHPVNSQAVFSIPNMQEPLFSIFGLLGLWLAIRFDRLGALVASAGCLLLSLLAKETGIAYVFIAIVYSFMFNRKRLVLRALGSVAICVVYVVMKVHAVGLASNPHLAPIDNLNLLGRLASGPAILAQYFSSLLFPLHIASSYYWTDSYSSIRNFWLPLSFVVCVVVLLVYFGVFLRYKYETWVKPYVFFGVWLAAGLMLHMQIIPLDATASDAWLYFPIVGLLGMVGISFSVVRKLHSRLIAVIVICLIVALGVRSYLRGFDWRSQPKLASIDLPISKDDYVAQFIVANDLLDQGKVSQAKAYAVHSVGTYTVAANTNILGRIFYRQGDFTQARQVFLLGIGHQKYYLLYEDMANLSLVYGRPQQSATFLTEAVKRYPTDATLWLALAVARARSGDMSGARSAISTAHADGHTALISNVYAKIMLQSS
jgi:tetratricopeptide (TPR) repeat protein